MDTVEIYRVIEHDFAQVKPLPRGHCENTILPDGGVTYSLMSSRNLDHFLLCCPYSAAVNQRQGETIRNEVSTNIYVGLRERRKNATVQVQAGLAGFGRV